MQQVAGCLSLLFTAGTVPVSASDEITEISEQSIVYWSMWEEDEPQADVIREAAEAYERSHRYFCGDSSGRAEEISDSYRTCAWMHGGQIDLLTMIIRGWLRNTADYLAELDKEWQIPWIIETHIMPVLREQMKNCGNGEQLVTMPYQPYITGVWV
ncbi:MAG: hypothetical protein ACLUTA_15935 [Blautia wexlerae]